MHSLLRTARRMLSASYLRRTRKVRQFGIITLGSFASLLVAPCGVFAQSTATIELSPLVAKSTFLSALDSAQEVSVLLSLPLRDARGAADFVQRVSDPKDPLFRQYITAAEFGARFGASETDYAALKDWSNANGLTIAHESVARTSLTVRGTVAQIQTLFKTHLNNYRSPNGDEFYSANVKPTIPSEIASKIAGLVGLTEGARYAPHFQIAKVLGEEPVTPNVRTDTAGGTGPGGSYAASDLRTAYRIPNFGGLIPQTVALFEQGGFAATDITKYLTKNGLPNVPIKSISVDHSSIKPNQASVEAVLDIDMVIGINPAVKDILVYIDSYKHDNINVALVDAFDQIATDKKAQTLSVSYGVDEVQSGSSAIAAENTELQKLAAAGITVLVSAGDDGAYGRTGIIAKPPCPLNAPDPGSQPLVTCVGGTSLYTGVNAEYNGEDVWNDLGIGAGATGGGVSSVWTLADAPYQLPAYVTGNGGSSTHRNVPDVAAIGNPLTGVGIYVKAAGGWIQIGGTSVAAPIWGGYISVLNSGLGFLTAKGNTLDQIGQFNPILYSISAGDPAHYLYSVLDGTNGNINLYGTAGYTAGLGYNNCCGSGSLWGGGLAFSVLTAATVSPPPFVGGPYVAPTTNSVKVTWGASPGATGYAVSLIRLLQIHGQLFLTYDAQTFVTKATKLTITGLQSKQIYSLGVGALNQTGASTTGGAFSTK